MDFCCVFKNVANVKILLDIASLLKIYNFFFYAENAADDTEIELSCCAKWVRFAIET